MAVYLHGAKILAPAGLLFLARAIGPEVEGALRQ